jgi:hypothetical protein
MREYLKELARVLSDQGEDALALVVRSVVSGDDPKLNEFLVSNELWGGPGSIADQAGMARGRESRRAIEEVLIRLGQEQMRAGRVNSRTSMWTQVFTKWQRDESCAAAGEREHVSPTWTSKGRC